MSAYDDAQQALLKAIKSTTEEVGAGTGNTAIRANTLQSLALAFRYTVGGAQPGSVTVEK